MRAQPHCKNLQTVPKHASMIGIGRRRWGTVDHEIPGIGCEVRWLRPACQTGAARFALHRSAYMAEGPADEL
jgi:hypothetical protein